MVENLNDLKKRELKDKHTRHMKGKPDRGDYAWDTEEDRANKRPDNRGRVQ